MDQRFPGPPLPPPVPSLSHPEHLVQFYSDDDALLDVWAEVLSNAVETGDGAICVATTVHQDRLAERLKQRGQSIKAAIEQGRYLWFNAAETLATLMPGGKLDEAGASKFFVGAISKARSAVNRDEARVVLLGEMVALLWMEGEYDHVIRLEHLCNDLGPAHEVSIHCGFPMRAFNREQDSDYFQRICDEHSAVIFPEGLLGFSSEKDLVYPGSELNHVMAQAEQLIQKDASLPYPEWQGHYRTALMETGRNHLFKKSEIAEAAVLTRLHELQPAIENLAERQQLLLARRGLQIIKKHKLGFSRPGRQGDGFGSAG